MAQRPDDDVADVGYPVHWEADVVLRDGGTAHVRPITPADADLLQAFHVRQSERSTYFRFFAPMERLGPRDLERFTRVDHRDRVALIALVRTDDAADAERIVGVARFDRTGPTTAEVAFNVADDHHGRGVGSVLLEHLAGAARERGVHRFTADVLPQNGQMLAVFREAGYELRQRYEDGVVTVSFGIDPTERSRAVMADREHRAEARSVLGLLTPGTVLVVLGPGAEGRLGEAVVRHLAAAGGDVVVHVVRTGAGPDGEVTAGAAGDGAGSGEASGGVHRAERPEDVPGPVDLLVLDVPAAVAPDVVRRCARLRPRAVVVLSGGFAERGPEGADLQRRLVRDAHAAGMRVLGPASFGFLRTTPSGAVNVSLAAELPRPGRVGLFCQSAPLAVGLLGSARRRRLGLSTFVSSGNRADVSGNDAMQFWAQDDATDVVALHLESIGNPRKFARVARRLAASKPVVVLTAGRSGHVVPPGHVVRRTRVPRRALDELMTQAGVVRVDNAHQLLDVAQLLAHQPLPAGRRVAVVASSEPLAALVAEASESAGLSVVQQHALGSGADETELTERLAAVCADPEVDAVVVVQVPTLGEVDAAVPRAVARAAARTGTTTVACLLGLTGVTDELTAPDADGVPRTVPAYAAPEDGVVALAAAARYAAWRTADHGEPLQRPDVDAVTARRLVERWLDGRDDAVVPLDASQAAELVACYGLAVWPVRVVRDADEAVAAADALGWPVALKCTAAHLRHRIDLGGVRLDLPDAPSLRQAMEHMRTTLARSDDDVGTFEVQGMAPGGAACVIRSAEDPRFGPVVSFGLAGDAVDLLGDVAHGVAPLTDVDVREMVRSVRASPRLFGYRGLPSLDVTALEDVLARVALMADDLPELRSLELHPVVVAERGVSVLAARAELAHAGPAVRADARRALPA